MTMEIFVWWEVPLRMRGGWRCALRTSGELCVTTPGIVMMLLLSVNSWDILTLEVSRHALERLSCTIQFTVYTVDLSCALANLAWFQEMVPLYINFYLMPLGFGRRKPSMLKYISYKLIGGP